MSDYPDHLNPFKESEKKKLGKTLSRSFRGFKGFIRQSFRKKKSKTSTDEDFPDVEIRKLQDFSYNTIRHNVMSMPNPTTRDTITSPPLPRSRFKERLHRSTLSSYDERCNPFAEEGPNPFDEPPIPYRRRKSKKNAPLPPSSSNPNVYLGHKMRGSSKWSLTSSETDYTLDDKSENSGDITYYAQSLRECLDNFNREMDTLNKESLDIGGSSPNILEADRNGQICEVQLGNIQKSKIDIDCTDEEDIREINNNDTELFNSTEVTPENSEEKTKIIIDEEHHQISEDHSNIDMKEEEKNQLNTKLSKPDIKQCDEKPTENGELVRVEYEADNDEVKNDNIPLEEKNERSNEVYENISKEPEEDIKKITDEPSVKTDMVHTHQVNSIPQIDKEEGYEIVMENLEDIMEKLYVHNDLEYIDEDNSSHNNSEENQSNGTLAVATSNSKDTSIITKQRKYKLDKLILLGENSSPE